MKNRAILLVLALLVVLGFRLAVGAFGASSSPQVDMIKIEGVIDPAMADYLARGLEVAAANQAQCLIVQMNTPGGLGNSMDKMVDLLLNSPLPVVVYIAPRGAQAFSAGTFITLAADFAVMHPNSTIGAAHPLELLPVAPSGGEQGKGASEERSALMEKVVNAYATKARTIAEARGRNADWAEGAVRKSLTATATEAVKLKIVDSVQPDLPSLLAWLDGRSVKIGNQQVTLHTKDAKIVEIAASIKDRFLHQLADPNLLLILLALAAMGILFELQNPGGILPGVVGGIALLLALYSLSILPVTVAGLALIGFGFLLLIADIKVPSHGILTLGGLASFIIGGLMLIDTRYAGVLKMSLTAVVATAILLGGFFVFAIGAAIRAHLRQPTTGKEGMIGEIGRVTAAISPGTEGQIAIEGELWRAASKEDSLAVDEKAQVVAFDGMALVVRRPTGEILKSKTS